MYPVPQHKFENKLVCSLLIDSANILFREHMPEVDRDGDEWLPWRNRVIDAYLPTASAALPMSLGRFAPAPSEYSSVVVEMPLPALESVSAAFLRFLVEAFFVEQASLSGVRVYDGERRAELEDAILKTAARVAQKWKRAWF